jgi:hypothetical protein
LDIAVVALMDHDNKVKVEDPFQRRRMLLPREVASGATLKASLFFPVTERPKRLALRGHSGEQAFEVAIELNASIR